MTPIIFHIDVNSAYLSWTAVEQLKNGAKVDLREIPAIIGGDQKSRHGVVLAKSPAAKRYGIRTGEPVANAFRKCPNLAMYPPDHKMYREKSRRLMEYLRTFTKEIEQVSVDECYMDFTSIADHYSSPVEGAAVIKDGIRERFGFTVNIGISTNKLLAKMASDFEKPDKVHTLFPEEVPEKMWPLPVRELFGIGRSTEKKLEELGIHTIGELAQSDREALIRNMKSQGAMIRDYANGIESVPMVSKGVENKGYGNSVTLPSDLTEMEDVRLVLLSLCETVAARLRMDQMKGSVVTVQLVDSSFRRWSHQENLGHLTDSTNEIYASACRLLKEMWKNRPVRLIGVQVSKAAKEEYHQMTLFGEAETEKQRKLDAAIDAIRGKYGEDAIKRTSFLNSQYSHMSKGLNQAKRKKQDKM